MKQCSKCKEWKEFNEFFKDKRLSSGYRADCKKCCAERRKRYAHTEHGKQKIKNWWNSEKGQTLKIKRRPKNVENVTKYHKTEKGKETHKRASVKYRQNHSDKVNAHNVIRVEKIRGNILPASNYTCSICQINQANYYHHPDYSKPLNVIPVCSKCHAKIHSS